MLTINGCKNVDQLVLTGIDVGAVLTKDDSNDAVPCALDCNVAAGVVFTVKMSEDIGS